MTSVQEQLLVTLEGLISEKLKKFKWHLENDGLASAAALENADAIDTVKLIVSRCGPEGAVQITLAILRKMNENHLAKQLEDKLKDQHKCLETAEKHRVKPDSHQLNLDLNTVNKHLHLSVGNREITYSETLQPYPDHPDRFDVYIQVLCRESVCGRCYWEIEWSGNGVSISVSYKSISRKGMFNNECMFGYNDQSWSLFCFHSSCSFRHNNIKTELPVVSSRRIGVYVDHRAGTLSFYSVSDTMRLIHTVQTTFTQPLYPGFGVNYPKSSVKLC